MPGPPRAAAPAPDRKAGRPPFREPVWLVRAVLVLFVIGFAAFLGREVARAILDFRG